MEHLGDMKCEMGGGGAKEQLHRMNREMDGIRERKQEKKPYRIKTESEQV